MSSSHRLHQTARLLSFGSKRDAQLLRRLVRVYRAAVKRSKGYTCEYTERNTDGGVYEYTDLTRAEKKSWVVMSYVGMTRNYGLCENESLFISRTHRRAAEARSLNLVCLTSETFGKHYDVFPSSKQPTRAS